MFYLPWLPFLISCNCSKGLLRTTLVGELGSFVEKDSFLSLVALISFNQLKKMILAVKTASNTFIIF